MRGLGQHIAGIDGDHAGFTRHIVPVALRIARLQARLCSSDKQGDEVDVFVSGRANFTRLNIIGQRRIVQDAQQVLLTVLHHPRQRF